MFKMKNALTRINSRLDTTESQICKMKVIDIILNETERKWTELI